MKIKELLKDPKHWFGWLLTTGAIVGFAHLVGAHAIHKSFFTVGGLLLVVVLVDLFKHKTGLQ